MDAPRSISVEKLPVDLARFRTESTASATRSMAPNGAVVITFSAQLGPNDPITDRTESVSQAFVYSRSLKSSAPSW